MYVGFLTTKEGEERNKLFSGLMDNKHLHSIRRTNKGMTTILLVGYSGYLGWVLDKYFPDKRTSDTLNIRASLMFGLANLPIDPTNPTTLPEDKLLFDFDPSDEPGQRVL